VLGPENALLTKSVGLVDLCGAAPALDIVISPLTLIAPTGLGKSQLLRALAATWSRQHGSDGAVLIDAVDFARGYSTALKLDDVVRFQHRFQRMDCLLIDNLDSLQSKDGAQQQLAIIIEHRQRQQRPTVLTARQPLQLLGLSARLSSRLAGGLVIPLQLPAATTRQAILQRLCERRRIELTPEAERLLSEQGPATVPQLTGVLNQIQQQMRRSSTSGVTTSRIAASRVARAERRESPTSSMPVRKIALPSAGEIEPPAVPEAASRRCRIDAELVRRWLDAHGNEPVDARAIIRATARYFGLPQRNLTGSSRRKLDVLARSFAMFLMRELTGSSFQQIGQLFGGRDHTTVIHAYKKVSQQQTTDMTTCHALREIRDTLNERSPAVAGRPATQRAGAGPLPQDR
jgi:chromosomal replication initiator protein